LLTPTNFPDYELIDCGDFEKLERFGKYITIRPEPQAVWSKKLSMQEQIELYERLNNPRLKDTEK
jgi:23S rRNA (cytosine1962-C5)-methyltransferase